MPAGRTIEVQEFLDRHPVSGFQWLIFGICFAIVLMDGFDTAAIGFVAPSLVADWGIARADLAPVLSAALFGLALGALAAGPLADVVGRRRVLIGAVGVFGAACLASAFSEGLSTLVMLRFATGLGLGAAMPNAVTLMSEFCPSARRATLTNAMFCGFPVGASLGGFLAAWMIPTFGWRSVLGLGGVMPLALAVVLVVSLPESIRLMVARGDPADRIRRVLARISPEASDAAAFTLREPEAAEQDAGAPRWGGVATIFSGDHLVGTLMLWIAYFMGLVIFYSVINWMPILLKDAGMSGPQAALVAALFPLGGFGAILSGWLMDRMNANLVIAACYALTALAIWAVGQAVGQPALLVAVVLIGGTFMNTGQSSMGALAAAFYPTSGRATGVASMLGVGRFGAIAGSFLVAELTRRNLDLATIFAVVAIPGLLAAAALATKQLVHPERRLEAVSPSERLALH